MQGEVDTYNERYACEGEKWKLSEQRRKEAPSSPQSATEFHIP